MGCDRPALMIGTTCTCSLGHGFRCRECIYVTALGGLGSACRRCPPWCCMAVQATIMGSRTAQSHLVPGRVVLWANPINGLTEAAVVLGDTPPGCVMPDISASGKTGTGAAAAGAGANSLLSSNSSAAGGSSDKRVALLVLHRPGAVDDRHLAQLASHRAAAQPAKPAAASMQGTRAGVIEHVASSRP
jgi:hypothetical protein